MISSDTLSRMIKLPNIYAHVVYKGCLVLLPHTILPPQCLVLLYIGIEIQPSVPKGIVLASQKYIKRESKIALHPSIIWRENEEAGKEAELLLVQRRKIRKKMK